MINERQRSDVCAVADMDTRKLSTVTERYSEDKHFHLTHPRLLNIHVVSKHAGIRSDVVSAVRAGDFPSCGAPIRPVLAGVGLNSTHLPSPIPDLLFIKISLPFSLVLFSAPAGTI